MSDKSFRGKRVYTPPALENLKQPLKQPLKVSGPPVEMWICSPDLVTVAVHWTGERNQPCTGELAREDCQHCTKGLPWNKQHWLTVQCTNRGSPVQLVCLTTLAVRFEPLLLAWSGHLEGHKLRLWRVPCQFRGSMCAEINREHFSNFVPDVPDTFEVLKKMWGGRLRKVQFEEAAEPEKVQPRAQPAPKHADERMAKAEEVRAMVAKLSSQLGSVEPKGAQQ